MIVRPRPPWFLIFFVLRGSILPKILPQLCLTLGLSILVVIFQGELLHWKITLTAVPFSLLGVTLAIFLSFRNSASYERFLEARRLWGRFLIDGRNLTRQLLAFTERPPTAIVHATIAFVQAVKHQLRGTSPADDFARLLPAALAGALGRHPAPARRLLAQLSVDVQRAAHTAHLDPILSVEIDRNLTGLNDALGGCERIAHTPIPFTYSVILHRTVYLYCILLPFGLLDSIGIMTPVMVAIVAYTFFAIEALSDELENPFGLDANDLALEAMCRDIEITLRDMLGEDPLLPPIQAVDYELH